VQTSPTRPADLIPQLRSEITGRVIGPDDADYDAARTVVMGGIDRHPAAIVRVADAADVARAIAAAKDTGLELAVRCGGHSGAAHSTTEGGIVIDVRDLKSLDIDVDGRTAWAGAGLTAGEYSKAAAAHGLATGFGDTASVGLGGLTLGGGIGYLVRKFGMTIDSLLAAEIVTADGETRQVDADHEPDLFWAIRGGGGNFGVATRFKLELQEVPSIVGGMLLLPATGDTIAALICYAGDAEAGERAIAPLRALATPLADMVKPMSYPEIYGPESEEEYHPIAAARTMFLDRVDHGVAETILEHLEASNAMMAVTQLRVLGGAMARIADDATAFAHRKSRILANVAAIYESVADKDVHEAWVDRLVDALRQEDGGAYVNFVGNEGEAGVHQAYPEKTWERLAEIKRRYDPTNLFRLNQNIPPATA
jgi:FAD/FMN-containing dehydrogenase